MTSNVKSLIIFTLKWCCWPPMWSPWYIKIYIFWCWPFKRPVYLTSGVVSTARSWFYVRIFCGEFDRIAVDLRQAYAAFESGCFILLQNCFSFYFFIKRLYCSKNHDTLKASFFKTGSRYLYKITMKKFKRKRANRKQSKISLFSKKNKIKLVE